MDTSWFLRPSLLQRLEGLALLVVALGVSSQSGVPWAWFFLLLLSPGLFMLGYLKDARTGGAIYNVGHLLLWPLLLLALGYLGYGPLYAGLGAIWLAHIGMDRAFGYGFKLESGFHDTHLGRIGKSTPLPEGIPPTE
ncbi:MAG: DUF4260 domain-containing protein [Deinococcus sp.]|nr:DUF4260 domain-containing protein [Deinococcus sp.]